MASTPGRENMGSDVPQGLLARVVDGIKYAVTGVGPMNFFGPSQPIQPIAQDAAEGRALDYPVGFNLRMQPREGETAFQTLRNIADGYDLLRLVIETRKDQIEAFDWEIVPRKKKEPKPRARKAPPPRMGTPLPEQILPKPPEPKPGVAKLFGKPPADAGAKPPPPAANDDQADPTAPPQKSPEDLAEEAAIDKVLEFLQSPDQEHDWSQWLRMQIEDLLVIDAIAVYPRMNKGGDLYGFELVDPATIKRVIDDTGRTPLPPDVAYQQILKGLPAVDYSRDQLIYTMRNPRTNRFYGYSPVEQVMMTVNIALRRQLSQLQFYTEGNVPEALAQVPDNWTAKQIAEFQTWWDSVMEGNTAQRRKMRFLPNLANIEFPKKELLKDEYDEWLARIVCFAFSIAPTALIKQVNRASGQQMADTAKEEGLMPLLRFLEGHITRLIRRYVKGADGLKFQFKIVNRVAPDAQAKIHTAYIDAQVMTPDEVREELEMEPMDEQEREAAWPTPIPPGMNADGTPILPLGSAEAKPPAAPGAPPGGSPTPAEKMLAETLRMLDPAQLRKLAQDLAPNVVHVAGPEVNVGDVNVHVPVARPNAEVVALAKRHEDARERDIEALLKVASREQVINVHPPAVTINNEAPIVNHQAGDVHVAPAAVSVAPAAVHFQAGGVHVAAPEVPKIDVHHHEAPKPKQEIEEIERGHDGSIRRITRTAA